MVFRRKPGLEAMNLGFLQIVFSHFVEQGKGSGLFKTGLRAVSCVSSKLFVAQVGFSSILWRRPKKAKMCFHGVGWWIAKKKKKKKKKKRGPREGLSLNAIKTRDRYQKKERERWNRNIRT
jgi:hypothetical protein